MSAEWVPHSKNDSGPEWVSVVGGGLEAPQGRAVQRLFLTTGMDPSTQTLETKETSHSL